jgi:uncharacterized protein (TIGR02001 family)
MGSALTAAAADVAGNVTLATDYRFRGISQLKGQFSPAIQGGFDFATDVGFYIGTWASNVNFTEGAIETDVYGGFKGMIDEELAYDIGVLYYGYPHDGNNDNDLAYTEVYGSLTYKGFKFGVNYSDDYFAESGKFFYPYIDYGFDPIENLTLSFHYGYNSFDEEQAPKKDGVLLCSELSSVEFRLDVVDIEQDAASDAHPARRPPLFGAR